AGGVSGSRRIRRTLLSVLGGCGPVSQAAQPRLAHPLCPGCDRRAQGWSIQSDRSPLLDPRLSRERVSLLRNARRAGRTQSQAPSRPGTAGCAVLVAAACVELTK